MLGPIRLALVLASTLAALALPTSASAYVGVDGTGEPAFTKGTTNTYFVYYNSCCEAWRLLWRWYDNGALDGSGYGPYRATNLTNAKDKLGLTGLVEGHNYGVCGTGQYTLSGIEFPESSNSCGDGIIAGKLTNSTVDLTKPAIAVSVNGTQQFTNNPVLQYHIDYQDALAFPFPANYVCTGLGAPCPSATYTAACSSPNSYLNRINSFDCSQDMSGSPDGTIYFCAIAADAAIPDVPGNANQGGNSNNANLSDPQCGYVTLDRAPPAVSVSATPGTTVKVGDLVSFSSSATDGVSGVPGATTWNFGDNTAGATGTSATHTYTSAGTYNVSASTSDGAGNPGSGNLTITVVPPTSSGTGTSTGTTTTTGGTVTTTAPSSGTISKDAGGGGVTKTELGGTAGVPGLEVMAPKRFKLRRKPRPMILAFTSESAGKVSIALLRRTKIVSKGGVTLTKAGTFGFKLKLPRKLKNGTYSLKVSWTPAGATRAVTKTLKIKFTGGVRSSRAKVTTRVGGFGTKATLPDGVHPPSRIGAIAPGPRYSRGQR